MRISDWSSDVCSSDLSSPSDVAPYPARHALRTAAITWSLTNVSHHEDSVPTVSGHTFSAPGVRAATMDSGVGACRMPELAAVFTVSTNERTARSTAGATTSYSIRSRARSMDAADRPPSVIITSSAGSGPDDRQHQTHSAG